MSIHGIDHAAGSPVPDPRQAGSSEGPSANPPGSESTVPDADRVEISPEARELSRLAESGSAEATAPERSVTSEHLRTILNRLEDGFYDGPDVQLDIARKIVADPGFDSGAPSGSP